MTATYTGAARDTAPAETRTYSSKRVMRPCVHGDAT
jgi:hypothetical protein